MGAGFQPKDYEFAFYLRQKGYRPQLTLNCGNLKEEYNKSQGNVKVYISHYVDETKLEIKNEDGNIKVIKLVSAQEWLDKYYPKNEVVSTREKSPLWNNKGRNRSDITRLRVDEKNLEGDLDLSEFEGLTVLNCRGNKLTKLDISKNTNLTLLMCYDNELTNLDLIKLERLDISNTDIDRGLEYLPNTVQELKFSSGERTDSKVKRIEEQLRTHNESIRYLEIRIKELVNLIKSQKRKLFDIFTRLLPDQEEILELIKNLIITHLEYIRVSKQKLPSVKLRRQRDRIRDKLENSLGDDLVEEIQGVLEDCEDLAVKKITKDKEEKIVKLTQQEETNREQLQQLKKEEKNSVIIEINRLQGRLEAREEEVSPILKKGLALNQEILSNAKNFLEVKRIFLNARQITIKGLQNCYNKLKGNEKYAKGDEVGNIISALGGVANSLTFGIPKAFGEAITAINNSFRRKFSGDQIKEFTELLSNDKENFLQLNKVMVSNSNTSQELKLFNAKYKIFDIVIKEGV
ncbi:14111_t:CDS:2 [Funneliformis geosporum]|nr:14111_t:CDS:2 [Funneliformis geosporum]